MNNWQIIYNSLTVGAGTPYVLVKVTGLHDTPNVRTSDQDRPRQHGQYPGADYHGGRSIQATVTIVANPNTAATSWDAFSLAMVTGKKTESPLLVQIPGLASGRTLQIGARVRQLALPIDFDYRDGAGRAVVQWWATDPLFYDATPTTLSTSMASLSGGGRTYPHIYPRVYGGAVSGGTILASNAGEVDAPWQATITGPIDNPSIYNVSTGQTLGFTGSLLTGETLVLDSLEKSVLFAGTVSRYTWLTFVSQWFDLAPGVNQLQFTGTAGTGTLTTTFRSAWI
jgi:hypothetical protein